MQFVVGQYEVRVQIPYPDRIPVAVGNSTSTSFTQLLQIRCNDLVVRTQMLGKKLAVTILRLRTLAAFRSRRKSLETQLHPAMRKHAVLTTSVDYEVAILVNAQRAPTDHVALGPVPYGPYRRRALHSRSKRCLP